MQDKWFIKSFLISLIFLGCDDDTGYVPGSILAAQEEKEKEEAARQEKRQDAIILINDGKTALEKVVADISDMIDLWNAVKDVERATNRAELALVSLGSVDEKFTDASVLLDMSYTCENNYLVNLRRIANYCSSFLNKFIDYLDDEEHDPLKLDDANQYFFQAQREIDEYRALPSCN